MRDRTLSVVTVALVVAALATVAIARASAGGAQFGAAVARSELQPDVGAPAAQSATAVTLSLGSAAQPADGAEGVLLAPTPTPAAAPTATPEPPRQATAIPAVTARPTAAAPTVVVPNVAATTGTTACPSTWFCYPRLALAGPIVPYADCSGSTDVGGSIRSFTCLSDHYLMGHAYTSFGLIRGWIAGDVVYAYGTSFTVTGAVTQSSCASPQFPLAVLSLQTSLTSHACGEVLVVQAH
jgi:hypothetical protein